MQAVTHGPVPEVALAFVVSGVLERCRDYTHVMALTYTIDSDAGIVLGTATGPISTQDIADYQARVSADPLFSPAHHQLIDFRESTPTDIFGPQVEGLLTASPFSSASRRAYVVSPGVGFGLARMAEMMTDGRLPVRAFEDIESAREWLLQP